MGTTQFDEQAHPRATSGQFATKPVQDAAGGFDALSAPTLAESTTPDVQAQMDAAWDEYEGETFYDARFDPSAELDDLAAYGPGSTAGAR